MSKVFWGILILTVAALIGLFFIFNRDSSPQDGQQSQDPNVISSQDHVKGNPDAKVTLIEYGDFQCPACKAAEPLLEQLNREYADRLRFVFRHFPITNRHPNAFVAARAAEAAGAQGKFFEMHDLLYQKQDEWAKSTEAQKIFRDYAAQLGLEIEQFNDAMGSKSTIEHINNDVELGKKQGADATPTFILNGQKLEPNPRSYEELKAKIEAELAKNP